MKKIFLKAAIFAVAILASVTSASAQKGAMAAGGSLVLGSGDSHSNFGIEGKFRYGITDPIRAEASFTYFLENDYWNMWDFSAVGHYLFPINDKLVAYPLAGLSVLGVSVDGIDYGYGRSEGYSKSYIGLVVGGGVDYELTPSLLLNAELKYRLGDFDRLFLGAGVVFKF